MAMAMARRAPEAAKAFQVQSRPSVVGTMVMDTGHVDRTTRVTGMSRW